jgi:hypothetical protein
MASSSWSHRSFVNACCEVLKYECKALCPGFETLDGTAKNWTDFWVMTDSVRGKDKMAQQGLKKEVEVPKVQRRMREVLERLCVSSNFRRYQIALTLHRAYLVPRG